MIRTQLVAATFIIGIAAGPIPEPLALRQLSLQQKNAATQTYVQTATDCIARAVTTDSRFRKDDPAFALGDLIIASMPKCVDPVRAMIAAYDRYFGDGFGEQFFIGPYLDILPKAVLKRASEPSD